MRRTGLTIALLVAVCAAATLASPAQGLSGTSFESTDGNLEAASGLDWSNVGISCTSTAVGGCGLDKPSGTTDDSLGGGSKDDNATQRVGTGSIPNNKSDLLRFYIADRFVDENGFLFLAWERANTLGTANFSFEINQQRQAPVPLAGDYTYNRTPGDLLVLYDFAAGGKGSKVELGLARWITTGNAKRDCQASNSLPCWSKIADLDRAGIADGSINNGFSVTDPIAPDAPRTLADRTFGEAAINLTKAGVLGSCAGFSAASVRSRSSSAFNSELKDFIAPIETLIFRPVDISGAKANGSALSARITDEALPDLADAPQANFAAEEWTLGTPVESAWSGLNGPGADSDESHIAEVNFSVPDGNPVTNEETDVLHIGALHNESESSVTAEPAQAVDTGIAEIIDVNILEGTLTADKIVAVANTTADQGGARYSSLEAGFSNLKIDVDGPEGPAAPVAYNRVAPNLRIGLSEAAFGPGSYVQLYQEQGSTQVPPPGTALGTPVKFESDLTVTMIRVHITDRDRGDVFSEEGNQTFDAVIGKASGHSEFADLLCSPVQEVGAHALNLSLTTEPGLLPIALGFTSIPKSGGHARSELEGFTSTDPLTGQTIVSVGKIVSDSLGGWDIDSSDSAAETSVSDVCVLQNPVNGSCTVGAELLKSHATSAASAGSRSSAAGVEVVGLQVGGQPIAVAEPNQRVDLPLGLGYVVLNEQICDNGAALPNCSNGTRAGNTGITVRALHVVILPSDDGTSLAELIVGEAHSDATFIAI